MPQSFPRPTANLTDQDSFSQREVGLTHPDLPSFIKLSDNGDIEITAVDGCMIILHPANRGITFIADKIRFLTKGFNGLYWNDLSFNAAAEKYVEPTFFAMDASSEARNIYQGANIFWS